MWSGTRLALFGTHQRAKWIRYQRLSPALVRPAPLRSRPVCPFLFAFLAAVYLTVEAEGEALREDFRRRALGAAGAVGYWR